jgi:hypothetical protein
MLAWIMMDLDGINDIDNINVETQNFASLQAHRVPRIPGIIPDIFTDAVQ